MTLIDWLFLLAGAVLAGWLIMAGIIINGDAKARRAWRLEDQRAEWREFVDTMRRLESEDRDDRGDA